jgi:hypothetical protein
MRGLLMLAVALSVVLPNPVFAGNKPLTALARVGKWEVIYDRDSCHLFGKFGQGADGIIAAFTRYTPGDGFDLTLYGSALKSAEVGPPVEITFGTQTPTKMKALAGTTEKKLPLLLLHGLQLNGAPSPTDFKPSNDNLSISAEQEKAIRSILIKLPKARYYQFDTGSMGPPMAAMRACTTDLIKNWGFDPAVQASLKQPAAPLNAPSKWLTSGDFPQKAIIGGESGVVQVRID